jgi:hypothetical protein
MVNDILAMHYVPSAMMQSRYWPHSASSQSILKDIDIKEVIGLPANTRTLTNSSLFPSTTTSLSNHPSLQSFNPFVEESSEFSFPSTSLLKVIRDQFLQPAYRTVSLMLLCFLTGVLAAT